MHASHQSFTTGFSSCVTPHLSFSLSNQISYVKTWTLVIQPADNFQDLVRTRGHINHTDSRIVLQSCDILSLCLQAVGGALSSTSSGGSKVAVDVSIAGLSFQVFTITVFIALAIEFALRYIGAQRGQQDKTPLPTGFKVFVIFLTAAIILILIRCAYRIDELSDGYNGPLIHNESLFIALEGA